MPGGAKSDVVFRATADEAKAINAFRKLVESQKQVEKGTKRVNAASRRTSKTMAGMSGNMRRMALGLIGGAGLSAGLYATARSFQESTQKARDFEKEITGLLSLGENIDNIGAIKNEVLGLSNAFDLTRQTTADFMFDLKSGTANLTQAMRDGLKKESLELAQVTGSDLPVALKVLTKAFQVYRGELGGVNDLQNKLFLAAQDGYITFQDMAEFLPDVLPPAKAFGYALDDILGGLVTATQYGGRTRKTMTGLRNVFLNMNKAADEGIVLQGSFADQLQRLGEVEPEVLTKIFGNDAIAVISTLAEKSGEVADNVEKISKVEGDIAKTKGLKRFADPAGRAAELQGIATRGGENAPLAGHGTEQAARLSTEFAIAQRGFRELAPSFMQGDKVSGAGAFLQMGADKILGKDSDVIPFRRMGEAAMESDLYASDQPEKATAFRLEHGIGQPRGTPKVVRDMSTASGVRVIGGNADVDAENRAKAQKYLGGQIAKGEAGQASDTQATEEDRQRRWQEAAGQYQGNMYDAAAQQSAANESFTAAQEFDQRAARATSPENARRMQQRAAGFRAQGQGHQEGADESFGKAQENAEVLQALQELTEAVREDTAATKDDAQATKASATGQGGPSAAQSLRPAYAGGVE